MITEEEYKSIKNEILNNFIAVSPSQNEDAWNKFFSIIDRISKNNWKRKDVHKLLWDLFNNYNDKLDESILDELGEFETAITGYCLPESIYKFPDDPEDLDQLTEHVRSNRWQN